MLLIAAQATLLLVALYFVLLGAVSLFKPARASSFLLGFATTSRKHYVELLARVVVGFSLLTIAPKSSYSMALSAFGWLLLLTTGVMALVPWRVHQRFAQASVPRALRFLPLIGVASLALGLALAWAVVNVSAT